MRSRLQANIFPAAALSLVELGQSLRRARLRRGIVVEDMAKRCMVTAPTYLKLEQGKPSVGLGVLAAALQALGMEGRLARLLESDPQGEAMAEQRMPKKARRPRSNIPGIDS